MVSQTSINAYHELVNSGHKFKQREKVFHFVNINGPATRRQIAKSTGIETGAIAGRVNKLVADGIFEEVDTVKCEYTDKMVGVVSIKGQEYQPELSL